jgi:hypothetical protein
MQPTKSSFIFDVCKSTMLQSEFQRFAKIIFSVNYCVSISSDDVLFSCSRSKLLTNAHKFLVMYVFIFSIRISPKIFLVVLLLRVDHFFIFSCLSTQLDTLSTVKNFIKHPSLRRCQCCHSTVSTWLSLLISIVIRLY